MTGVINMRMCAPAKFYEEQGIPVVRWMYPHQCYKARLITVPYKYDQAVMYIYVLDDRHVIAYRDVNLTCEIGMLRLEHFEKISELHVAQAPAYSSVCPRVLTYGDLLDNMDNLLGGMDSDMTSADKNDINSTDSVKEDTFVVTILPPDPPEQYEQLTLF